MIRNESAAKEIINIAVISLSAEESFFSYPLGVANPTVTDRKSVGRERVC